ncbi:hypothetical protein HMI55_002599 [Coelomomyces lativittatus]|nr:hypothetical protein HMI55_002599 [Coelomomyces lativittatus]KAJ1513439.1 hypothetical protein HMI56_002451 [Coelomomyces lativittatus]
MFGFKQYGNPPNIPYLKTAAAFLAMVISFSSLNYLVNWVEPEKLEDPAHKSEVPVSRPPTKEDVTNDMNLEECLMLYKEAKTRYDKLNKDSQDIIQKIKRIHTASQLS